MTNPECRHLGQPEQLCRFDPPVTGDDLVVIINQDRIAESKPRDAFRDFLDLLARVGPRVCLVRHKLAHRRDFNFAAGAVKGTWLLPSADNRGEARRTGTARLFVVKFHFPSLSALADVNHPRAYT